MGGWVWPVGPQLADSFEEDERILNVDPSPFMLALLSAGLVCLFPCPSGVSLLKR